MTDEFNYHYDKIIKQYGLHHLMKKKKSNSINIINSINTINIINMTQDTRIINYTHEFDDNNNENTSEIPEIPDMDMTINLTNLSKTIDDSRYMPMIENKPTEELFQDTTGLDPDGYNKYTLINVNEYVPNMDTQFSSWFYFTTKLWRRQQTYKKITKGL